MGKPLTDVRLVKRAMNAIDNTARVMDAARYEIPAQKREKYFGGYRERLLEAQARAVLKIFSSAAKRIGS